MTATGPLGEMSVLPPQVELTEFKLGPRFSGKSNRVSKLDLKFLHALQVSALTWIVVGWKDECHRWAITD